MFALTAPVNTSFFTRTKKFFGTFKYFIRAFLYVFIFWIDMKRLRQSTGFVRKVMLDGGQVHKHFRPLASIALSKRHRTSAVDKKILSFFPLNIL